MASSAENADTHPPSSSQNPTSTHDPDPIIKSYDINLTETDIPRLVLQYLDRDPNSGYDEAHGQKPTSFRIKPQTGLLEVDVPINTSVNYDIPKGMRYGDALRKSRAAQGGGYGMAGGFATGGGSGGGGTGKVKVEGDFVEEGPKGLIGGGDLLRVQTLGGRIKVPETGDPVYMLATFRDGNMFLSPVSAVVQLRPQLHHLDALDEIPKKGGRSRKEEGEERGEPEARAVDVKIKAAATEDAEVALVQGNLELLKKMQEEKWSRFEWVDAETQEAWDVYEGYMMYQDTENLPQLKSAINGEDYLDSMSAPRIDPARPEMTGWAMKQNRKKQKESMGDAGSEGNAMQID